MAQYVVYEIVGIKVGCTKEYETRCAQNRVTYGAEIVIEILERHEGDDDTASEREIFWTKARSYKSNNTYADAIKSRRSAGVKSVNSPRHPVNVPAHQVNWREAGKHYETIIMRTQTTCPHCGKVGQTGNMFRWHFDKCKSKSNE